MNVFSPKAFPRHDCLKMTSLTLDIANRTLDVGYVLCVEPETDASEVLVVLNHLLAFTSLQLRMITTVALIEVLFK